MLSKFAAPSLVIGAFLGLSFALSLNHFFCTHLIPVNFMIIGMAAILSGCIHAPFTALALL
ncbi:chloride channel protein [Mucilaginibacter sp. FT3.2]|uniref:chloride channel protein n=1 Tax=Mucilaginibacter sp. FT3.2 TaxID=2723090 RepID=UPI001C889F59